MRHSEWEQHEMDVKSGKEMDRWADSAVDDAALDRWMNNHSQNPANLPDPTNKEQERREDAYSYEQYRDYAMDPRD